MHIISDAKPLKLNLLLLSVISSPEEEEVRTATLDPKSFYGRVSHAYYITSVVALSSSSLVKSHQVAGRSTCYFINFEHSVKNS